MSTGLVLIEAGQRLVQYKKMCKAISVCAGFDECKDVIDKSVAMAAYYAQIKDVETELMFHRVRIRAWRRISELISTVDVADCETMAAKVRKIRAAFPDDPTLSDMLDGRVIEVIKLGEIPDKEFESAIKQAITGSLADLFKRTPSAIAERLENERYWAKRREAEEKEREYARAQAAQDRQVAAREEKKEATLMEKHGDELYEAADQAMKEVGITLERKDRAKMKQVVFLIKREVHEVMRKSAFDKRLTMQEVLRRDSSYGWKPMATNGQTATGRHIVIQHWRMVNMKTSEKKSKIGPREAQLRAMREARVENKPKRRAKLKTVIVTAAMKQVGRGR